MNRILFGLAMMVIVGVAAWAYHINYRTGDTLREIDRLRAEIAARHEALQVLRVEWAYLNRPERLRDLVARHAPELALVPMSPDRFGDVAAVPYPKPAEVDPLEAALAAAAAAGAFIPTPDPKIGAALAAAAAERLDGGAAFFPVAVSAARAPLREQALTPEALTPEAQAERAGPVRPSSPAGLSEAIEQAVAAVTSAEAALPAPLPRPEVRP